MGNWIDEREQWHRDRIEAHNAGQRFAVDEADVQALAYDIAMVRCERYTMTREIVSDGDHVWNEQVWEWAEAMAHTGWKDPVRVDAEVAALKARIAELEEAQRWISCSERMPEYGVPVMAQSYGNPCPWVGNRSIVEDGWVIRTPLRSSDGRIMVIQVPPPTHWRPLPEPPKGETTDAI